MVKKKTIRNPILLITMVALFLALPWQASAAQTTVQQSWESTELTDDNPFYLNRDLTSIQSKGLVYVQTTTSVASQTKLWEVDVVKALDEKDGSLKWEYVFHKSGDAYPANSSFVYRPDGTVYASVETYGNEHQLYSINASGKEKWVKKVTVAGKLYALHDGSLLVVAEPKVDKSGNVNTQLLRYQKDGKQVYRKEITGEVLAVNGDQIVVNTSKRIKSGSYWTQKANPTIKVLNSGLKQMYTYAFPANASTIGDGDAPIHFLSDGTILYRYNETKSGNKLLALDPKGKKLWVRSIPGNAAVKAVKSSYVVYTGKKLELYNHKGKVTQKEFQGTSLPMNQVGVTQNESPELILNFEEKGYILNPANLDTVYEFPMGEASDQVPFGYSYVGKGIIYAEKEGKLLQYRVIQ